MNVVVSHVYDSTRVMLCSGFCICEADIYAVANVTVTVP